MSLFMSACFTPFLYLARWLAGFTDDQLCWHRDLLGSQLWFFDIFEKHFHSSAPHLVKWLVHGCELGVGVWSLRNIIEADNRDVLWDAQASLTNGFHCAECG